MTHVGASAGTLTITADGDAEFTEFVARGNGETDHSALLLHLEDRNASQGGKK